MNDSVKFIGGPKDGDVVEYESADFPMRSGGGVYRFEPDSFVPLTPAGEPLNGLGTVHSAEWHKPDAELPRPASSDEFVI